MADLDHRLLLSQQYALINPLQVESSLWSDLPTEPLALAPTIGKPEWMPRLLDLQKLTADQRIGLLDRCRTHARHQHKPYFSALLTSHADHERLFRHLSQQLVIAGPNGEQALFRYFDPSVFGHLHWLLNDRQMRAVFGPVECWTWRDSDGSWQQSRRTGPSAGSIRLVAAQWNSLKRLGLLSRCLQMLAREHPELARDDTLPQRFDKLLQESHELHGLEDESDRCLYASQAIRIHAAIHHHPQVRERLDRARSGSVSYMTACSDLQDTQLRMFAAELEHTPTFTRTIA